MEYHSKSIEMLKLPFVALLLLQALHDHLFYKGTLYVQKWDLCNSFHPWYILVIFLGSGLFTDCLAMLDSNSFYISITKKVLGVMLKFGTNLYSDNIWGRG